MRLAALGVIGLVVLAYLPLRWNGFVYEDARANAADHDRVAVPLRDRSVLTPGRWLSALLASPNARRAHAVSLGLHLLTTAGVGLLAWQLGMQTWWWVPMGLFGVLPIQTEAVAYAVERSELLAGLGIVAACCAAAARSPWRWIGVLAASWVAMAGKESGVVVIGLVGLVAWYQRRLSVGLVVCVALLGACACRAWPLVLAINHTDGASVSAWRWIGLQSAATWRLLSLTVYPQGLSIEHDYSRLTDGCVGLAAAGLVACPLGLISALRTRSRLVAFGLAWIVIALAPRFVVREPLAILPEHQFYAPMIGVSLLMGWLAMSWQKGLIDAQV